MSNSDDNNGFFSQPTRVVGSSDTRPRPQGGDATNQPTRVGGGNRQSPTGPAQASPLGPETRVFRPGAPSNPETAAPVAAETTGSAGPVVGWLVVIKGPGKGNSLPLGYGWNSVGRAEDQAVPLNFGDQEISRSNHCAVAYDPKNRNFFIQHGGGRNLTYLGSAPVLSPMALESGADIVLGDTTLRFVPFCGAHFDWQHSSD